MLLIVEPRTLDRAIERLAGRNRSVREDARAAIEWLTRGDEEGKRFREPARLTAGGRTLAPILHARTCGPRHSFS